MARYRQFSPPRERFPWLLLLALLASVAFFWLLPMRMGPQPVKVEFTPAPTENP